MLAYRCCYRDCSSGIIPPPLPTMPSKDEGF
jgi:hypothetical protein